MARKTIDCRRFPSASNCTLTITGEEGELLREAVMHAVSVHGEKDSPELREKLRQVMAEEGGMPRPSGPQPGEAVVQH